MDEFREEIIKLIKKEVKDADIVLEVPPQADMGDYAFPCFSLAKVYKKAPNEIAIDLSKKIKKILKEKDKYGSSDIGKNKKIVLEHTSINPNASPHVGRARNALIGDALARILKFQKYNVEVHYFVNDIGKQISMLVLAAKNKKNIGFDDLLKIYIDIAKKVEENEK